MVRLLGGNLLLSNWLANTPNLSEIKDVVQQRDVGVACAGSRFAVAIHPVV